MSVGDAAFQAAVDRLRRPGMGTEVVAPLLATLVRLVRPRHVLEVGMGYTTPFLAAALAEVEEQSRTEASALAAKSRRYVEDGAELDDRWLNADPALLSPKFYLRPHRTQFIAIDNLSIPESTAGDVVEVLRDLGLGDHVTVVNADLRDSIPLLPDGFAPIDMAWVDAWECLYFFDHFWELVNPAGGLVAMHYLMTYPEGEAILDYIGKVQAAHPGELEVLNLLEPHKLTQNSVTLLRRTSAGKPCTHAERGGRIVYDGTLREEATRLVHTDPSRPDTDAS